MSLKLKTTVFAFAFIFLSLLFLFFSIIPSFSQIKYDFEKIANQKSETEMLEKEISTIENFQKEKQKYQDFFSKLKKSFANKEIPVDFIDFLEKNASSCQAKIEIYSQKAEKDSLVFSLRLTAQPKNLLCFLQKIENGYFLVQVEKLSVVKISEKEEGAEKSQEFSPAGAKADFQIRVLAK
jgi:hypothetical protein